MCCTAGSICENHQCKQFAYNNSGGDKFLGPNRAVSELRLSISGVADSGDLSSFSASEGIGGDLAAFNYASRLLITSVSFSFFEGEIDANGDFSANGLGVALVNGVRTNIAFSDESIGGVPSFEISDADTGEFLAGGTGETGRSELSLTTSVI